MNAIFIVLFLAIGSLLVAGGLIIFFTHKKD
jgi:hypothetical protein